MQGREEKERDTAGNEGMCLTISILAEDEQEMKCKEKAT